MFSRLSDPEQQNYEPKQKQPNHHIIAVVPHLLLQVLAELAELPQDAACMMNLLRHQEQITINRNKICWHKSQITNFSMEGQGQKMLSALAQITINRNEMCWHKSQITIFLYGKTRTMSMLAQITNHNKQK